MSDITHYVRGEQRLREAIERDTAPPLDVAAVHADLAISRALREIDEKLKYVTGQLVAAIEQASGTVPVAAWVMLQNEQTAEPAVVPVSRIRMMLDDDRDDTSRVVLDDDTVWIAPGSPRQVADATGGGY